LEIGGIVYQDVTTEELTGSRIPDNPNDLRMIAFARGIGLVQFTRVNGSVFSLVP